MPLVRVVVEARLEKSGGKFVPKDELESVVADALESADEGTWYVEDSQYETSEWDVHVE